MLPPRRADPACVQHGRRGRLTARPIVLLLAAVLLAVPHAAAQAPALELRKGDTVIFLGGTLAERLQYHNHFETLLMARFPDLQLRVRNLAWSGDTPTLQPRPLNFGDAAKHLAQQKADVLLAFFGTSESFDGEAGLPRFEQDLGAWIATQLKARYNGQSPPRLAMVSPIAHEALPGLKHVDVGARNRDLARYTDAMRRVAAQQNVPFVDLFTPSKRAMEENRGAPFTVNGMHVTERGDAVVAGLLMEGLGFLPSAARDAAGPRLRQLEALRADIHEKNQQFFYRWRPLNAEYVVGRRVEPFGSVSFPPEMRQLDEMVTDLDHRIWKRASAIGPVRYPIPSGRAAVPSKPPVPRKPAADPPLEKPAAPIRKTPSAQDR